MTWVNCVFLRALMILQSWGLVGHRRLDVEMLKLNALRTFLLVGIVQTVYTLRLF
uniref:Uncharacterized protein n=1 Tax=Anguilla anguilla TaxID=7936 RepID=A0A0E9UFJ0_ANGAN